MVESCGEGRHGGGIARGRRYARFGRRGLLTRLGRDDGDGRNVDRTIIFVARLVVKFAELDDAIFFSVGGERGNGGLRDALQIAPRGTDALFVDLDRSGFLSFFFGLRGGVLFRHP